MGKVNLVNANTQKARENFGVLVKKYPHTEQAADRAQVPARLGISNSEAGDSALNRPVCAPTGN